MNTENETPEDDQDVVTDLPELEPEDVPAPEAKWTDLPMVDMLNSLIRDLTSEPRFLNNPELQLIVRELRDRKKDACDMDERILARMEQAESEGGQED